MLPAAPGAALAGRAGFRVQISFSKQKGKNFVSPLPNGFY
jgi:hypothetical protein